jgi:hypothetical protein
VFSLCAKKNLKNNVMKCTIQCLILLVFLNVSFAGQMKTLSPQNSYPTDSRSDSIDIINTEINLRITDFTTKIISGNSKITFTPKVNGINKINLDLLSMTIDSVVSFNNQNLSYAYNDTLLKINLNQIFNLLEETNVTIYYHGAPGVEPNGFGGFYFQNNIAYNIGVAFIAKPHNYGRVWFPCFDNFTERFSIKTNITTLANHKAFCGGMLEDTIQNNDGTITWKWNLNETVPSYLVSVAVGAYTTIQKTFSGLNGPVKVQIGALPNDTNLVNGSFINLESCFDIFENKFGPHEFPRVGYVMVPFTSGAMEHVTNIAYPRGFINGQTTYEALLMAHELSHMWFGDLVTCKTHEDMWLNEGFASYCSELFTENHYSRRAFEYAIKANRDRVLHFANHKEGEYFPVSGVPHEYTYGEHTYLKGEDVANSLRGFLGDSLFFNGLRNYLQAKKFTACSSEDLRNFLQEYSGLDLTTFFNDWVFKGGFVDVTIDSFKVVTNAPGNIETNLFFKQRLKGTNTYYGTFPIEITIVDENWNEEKILVNVSSQSSNATITSAILPKVIFVNVNEKIGLASIGVTNTIRSNGTKSFEPAQITLNTTNITDSVLIRIVHHYTAPDGFKNPMPYRLSPQRFFSIEGILNTSYSGTAAFTYDGRSNGFSGNQYLDHLLINTVEDSLFLFFRKNAAEDWTIYPKYTKVMGIKTDKLGSIRIDSLAIGEYVLGIKDFLASSVINPGIEKGDFRIFPNPTESSFSIELQSSETKTNTVKVLDVWGNLIQEVQQENSQKIINVNLANAKPGIYFVFLNNNKVKRIIKT